MRYRTGAYRAQSLFVAGSAFLIEAEQSKSASVAHTLSSLLSTGLPVKAWNPSGALVDVGDWRTMPYLPENGYGEISVDDPAFNGDPA